MNLGDKKSLITMGVPLVIILIPLVASLAGFVFGQANGGGDEPFIEVSQWTETSCVRDARWMRFHHWELLREVRETVVRDGDRSGIRLDDCRRCHDNRDRFCNQCHREANVNLDCFGCHYYPETPAPESEDAHDPVPAPPPGAEPTGFQPDSVDVMGDEPVAPPPGGESDG
jgi:hypothetical protein